MRLYVHDEDYNTRRKMEGLKILIIAIIGFAIAGVASWYAYNNSFSPSKNVIGLSKEMNSGDTVFVFTLPQLFIGRL